ncbi:CD63 antigen-like isoform X2, partial [Dinothrombium tinctorium]
IIGIGLFGIGIHVLAMVSLIGPILTLPVAGAIVIIIGGLFLFMVACFGFIGMWKRSRRLINYYAIFVGILIVFQVVASVLFLVYTLNVVGEIHKEIRKAMFGYKTFQENDPRRKAVDGLQWLLKCCGMDFGLIEWLSSQKRLPKSCCFDPKDETKKNKCELGKEPAPFDIACRDVTEKTIRIFFAVVSGITVSMSIIQLVAAGYAYMLANYVY